MSKMSSTASTWMKRLGVGGQLAPFFKSVCVYFVALSVAGETGPSAAAVACKCAPVVCLLVAVACRYSSLPPGEGRRYAGLVCAGLSLSCVGDALLVWEQQLARGMLAFAGAHAAYVRALGWRPLRARAGLLAYCAAAAYLSLLSPRGAYRALVPAYAALLATMAWRAAAAARLRPAAALGAALFLASDAMLGYALFAAPVPHRQTLVMSTYYMGQLGIAYSALRPRPAR